jgi:putative spermidine/putrescine transport system substrate-binding protein
MERRRFLQALGLLSLEPLLFGCGDQSANQLRIQFLRGSLPLLLAKEFRRISPKVEFQIFDQLADMDKKLQDWQNSKSATAGGWRLPWQAAPNPHPPDLVTIGNSWLPGAIDKGSIRPLEIGQLPSWQKLDKKWQQLVTVNNKIWAAPYRWGSTVLIYRRDRLRQNGIAAIKDWADLWQPALRGKVVLLNQSQEIIGLTLKKLGHSYQTEPQKVPELLPQLQQLHRQALFYSSTDYMPPLLTGDAWVAVGWSSDLAEVLKRNNSDLAVVVPSSGTSLWADLWVRPTKAQATQIAMADRWIDFCWQSLAATKISELTGSVSTQATPAGERLDRLNKEAFDRAEFLPTLSSDVRRQYDVLWQAMGSKKI